MDVYGDSPTIVTTWLTVIPKLSILILLLELYLQIDGFEGSHLEYNPLMDYLFDFSALPQIVSDFFQVWGGVENYEAYRLANVHIQNIPADRIFEAGLHTIWTEKWASIAELFNITGLTWPEFQESFIYWQVDLGGGSDALHNLLFVSSLLSLIIGTVLGLAQNQIKRLMA